jgi:hypothetical protein
MDDVDIRASTATRGRADFGAIVAGAVVTGAVGVTLLALGASVGLAAIDPAQGDWGGRALLLRGGAWTMVSIVAATLVGAMTSVRLSAHYSRSEAAAQGLCAWALSFVGAILFTAWFTAAGLGAPAGEGPLTPEQQSAAASAGAWATWGLFLTSVLSAIAGAAGGIWGLPGGATRAEAKPVNEPLRPVEP